MATKGIGLSAIFIIPLSLIVLVIVPFFLLLRLSVFLWLNFGISEISCLAISACITFLLVFFYVSFILRKIKGKKKLNAKTRMKNLKISGALVGFYFLYVLLYKGAINAKSIEIKEQFSSLHPLLRMAVSNIIIIDKSLVVTDLARTHSDYEKMGLEGKKKSLHYFQSDGFVHALDLRTSGRPEWKNNLVKFYFNSLGFNTLRHTGTADHLHVSLTAKDNLRGI